jgi:hypothetical protein
MNLTMLHRKSVTLVTNIETLRLETSFLRRHQLRAESTGARIYDADTQTLPSGAFDATASLSA